MRLRLPARATRGGLGTAGGVILVGLVLAVSGGYLIWTGVPSLAGTGGATLAFALARVAFGGVLAFAGLGFGVVGVFVVVPPRAEIDILPEGLFARERLGPLAYGKRRRGRVTAVDIARTQLESKNDPELAAALPEIGGLQLAFADAKPLHVAQGYPLIVLREAAHAIGEEVTRIAAQPTLGGRAPEITITESGGWAV